MEKTLQALNAMVASGVIGSYAIGGAIAASYYIAPTATLDLDVFIPIQVDQLWLVAVRPLLDYLREHGHAAREACFEIEGWLVQFLPTHKSLTEEALAQARTAVYGQTSTRVLTAEHLAAIMLQVGRPKDKVRLALFCEADALDRGKFQALLARHHLVDAWQNFSRQFLPEKE